MSPQDLRGDSWRHIEALMSLCSLFVFIIQNKEIPKNTIINFIKAAVRNQSLGRSPGGGPKGPPEPSLGASRPCLPSEALPSDDLQLNRIK